MAPRTPFNAPITSHRRFAFRSVSLTSVKDIKNACGATLNDVVMAACAGGLRTWLERHDALPDEPLVAMVPVSIRTGRETEKWTNRVGSITSQLPTNEPDPVQRVHRVHESMLQAKELFDAVPADALTDFTQFAPPAVFAQAMRTSTRLSARFRSPVNVTISNVPGPREPLYAAGAKLLHYYPVSTVVDGQGLNITVQSYLDNLDFGLVSCRELVPDLWDMLDDIIDDIVKLGRQAGVNVEVGESPGPTRSRALRRPATTSTRTPGRPARPRLAAVGPQRGAPRPVTTGNGRGGRAERPYEISDLREWAGKNKIKVASAWSHPRSSRRAVPRGRPSLTRSGHQLARCVTPTMRPANPSNELTSPHGRAGGARDTLPNRRYRV